MGVTLAGRHGVCSPGGLPGPPRGPGELPVDTLGSVSFSRGMLLGWISTLCGVLGHNSGYLFGKFPAAQRAPRVAAFVLVCNSVPGGLSAEQLRLSLFREASMLIGYV